MKHNRRHFVLALAVGLAALPATAFAADGGDPVTPPSSVAAPFTLGGASSVAPPASVAAAAPVTVPMLLAEGRTAIAAKKWPDAIVVLKKAEALDPKNADVQNLLGFSSRNNGDYTSALAHYAAALKINPKHVGALEYQGVAYVLLGQTSKARANLASLQKICGTTCVQYKDLAAALKAAPKSKKKY